MSSRIPMHSRRAMPSKQQITTEYLRRRKNTSREINKFLLEEILKEYSDDFERDGFHPNWIGICLNSASKGYGRMIASEIKKLNTCQ